MYCIQIYIICMYVYIYTVYVYAYVVVYVFISIYMKVLAKKEKIIQVIQVMDDSLA